MRKSVYEKPRLATMHDPLLERLAEIQIGLEQLTELAKALEKDIIIDRLRIKGNTAPEHTR